MNARGRLAWNVRQFRTALGLSQEKLAIDAGIAAPYLSGIERGTVNPSLDLLERLAATLDVEIDTLLRVYDAEGEAPKPLRAGRKPKHGRSQKPPKEHPSQDQSD